MSRRPPAEEPPLFDLPLEPEPDAREWAEPEEPPEPQPELPLTPAADAPPEALEPEEAPPAVAPQPPAADKPPAGPLRSRLIAGLADLGVCAAVVVLLLVVLWSIGVEPVAADWPAAVLFLLSFSFLYEVLPLAFWGRTPGMALAGLRTTTPGGEPLTFGQTVRRWLASVLTVALVGLPALLALTGRSLADRLSGSVTRVRPARS